MNRKIKITAYTVAAGVLAFTTQTVSLATPIAGANVMLSTNQETIEANSYSTLSGINLALSKMTVQANKTADATVAELEAVAAIAQVEETLEEAEDEFASIGIAQVESFVNVRDTSSEDGEVVGKLYANSACEVLEEIENGWYHITSGTVDGYVKAEYVVVGDADLARSVARRVATVQTETLYIREAATTDSSVIGMLPYLDDITVIDESTYNDGWVKVSAEEGDGFVSVDYVTLATEYTYAESKAEEEARLAKEKAEREAAQKAAEAATAKKNEAKSQKSDSDSGESAASSSNTSYSAPSGGGGSAVVAYASQFVGNPYVYGGSSLTNGTDCSGFVMSVYAAFGVGLPHSSSADRSVGYAVSVDEIQPGDIVCYSGHVGIYAGNGNIVHASNPRTGICYSNMYYRNILAVRRIF